MAEKLVIELSVWVDMERDVEAVAYAKAIEAFAKSLAPDKVSESTFALDTEEHNAKMDEFYIDAIAAARMEGKDV